MLVFVSTDTDNSTTSITILIWFPNSRAGLKQNKTKKRCFFFTSEIFCFHESCGINKNVHLRSLSLFSLVVVQSNSNHVSAMVRPTKPLQKKKKVYQIIIFKDDGTKNAFTPKNICAKMTPINAEIVIFIFFLFCFVFREYLLDDCQFRTEFLCRWVIH